MRRFLDTQITDPLMTADHGDPLFQLEALFWQLVQGLRRQSWQAPGFTVGFATEGTGANRFYVPRTISTPDASLSLYRSSNQRDGQPDRAAATTFIIPQRELQVLGTADPVLTVYTGGDYEADRARFMQPKPPNNNRESWYLKYPADGFDFPAECQTIGRWIEQHLLGPLMRLEEPGKAVNPFQEAALPFPDTEPIYCFAALSDVQRIVRGQVNPHDLPEPLRYALTGGRMDPRVIQAGQTVPPSTYYSYRLGGLGEVYPHTNIKDLTAIGVPRYDEVFVVEVRPQCANGIYFADATGDDDALIPAHEYDGQFTEAIVAFGRELDFDEVRVVGGPWPECELVHFIRGLHGTVQLLLERAMVSQQLRIYGDKLTRDRCQQDLEALAACLADHHNLAEWLGPTAERIGFNHDPVSFVRLVVAIARTMRKLGLV